MTYKLTLQATTNSYSQLVLLEETDGAGNLLEASGRNIIYIGPVSFDFKPRNTIKAMGDLVAQNTMEIKFPDNKISITYDQIDGYSIYGTTAGLANMHAIWDAIASGSASSL